MVRQHLQGLIAAPFTPMHSDGSLNPGLIPLYYSMLKSNGIKGAFICGSTGEGVSLTINEKKAIAEAWAACTREDSDFLVMPLLGGTCLADCKELALHARKLGWMQFPLQRHFTLNRRMLKCWHNVALKLLPWFRVCHFIIIISRY